MIFLHPWAFGFGAIAPVIVALYLLKVRRRPVAVSTLMFWQRVLQENQRRALFQKLRQWLSLLLHLLIFAFVLLALARPTFDRAVHEGSSTVLIVDTRARMQALEPGGETRLARAQRRALEYVRQAGPARQFALLANGVQLGFSSDEKTLRAGIQGLQATSAGGDLQPGIRLAADLLASRAGETHIVVFTDRAEIPDPPSARVEFVPIGSPRENLAIIRFATRPLPASPETFEVFAEIANFGSQPWQGNLEVTLDDRPLDVRTLSLAPGEHKTTIFETVVKMNVTTLGRLVAKIDGHDALPLDDIAYALLQRAPPRRVLLVTKGNWFLEKLLAADQRIRFELLSPDAYQPPMGAQFDAVILDDLPPPMAGLSTPGNFLYLKQTPFNSGGPELEQPLVTDTLTDHPALPGVNLEHVTFARAAALEIPAVKAGWKFEAPIRFGDHPLLVTGENGPQRVAAFAFGVTDSDFPLRVAFPLVVAGTLHWLAGESPLETPSLLAGETLNSEDGPFTPTTNGFQQWHPVAGESAWIAVNTFAPAESDLRLAQAPAAARVPLPSLVRFTLGGWPAWSLLALAAAFLFTAEWWLFHRRHTE